MSQWFRRTVKSDELGISVQLEGAEGSRDFLVDWRVPAKLTSGEQLKVPWESQEHLTVLLRDIKEGMEQLSRDVQIYEALDREWRTLANLVDRSLDLPSSSIFAASLALQRLKTDGLAERQMVSGYGGNPLETWRRRSS